MRFRWGVAKHRLHACRCRGNQRCGKPDSARRHHRCHTVARCLERRRTAELGARNLPQFHLDGQPVACLYSAPGHHNATLPGNACRARCHRSGGVPPEPIAVVRILSPEAFSSRISGHGFNRNRHDETWISDGPSRLQQISCPTASPSSIGYVGERFCERAVASIQYRRDNRELRTFGQPRPTGRRHRLYNATGSSSGRRVTFTIRVAST